METLELLEEILLGFEGTVLLVSHDRVFMDNVLTSLIVLDGQGGVSEHVGGYSDWVARGGRLGDALAVGGDAVRGGETRAAPASHAAAPAKKAPLKRLSYKEQRELAELPAAIEGLEAAQAALSAELEDPGFYSQAAADIAAHAKRLADLHEQLERAIERWSELEERA